MISNRCPVNGEHCWHENDYGNEICCFCGQYKNEEKSGHGPFNPDSDDEDYPLNPVQKKGICAPVELDLTAKEAAGRG